MISIMQAVSFHVAIRVCDGTLDGLSVGVSLQLLLCWCHDSFLPSLMPLIWPWRPDLKRIIGNQAVGGEMTADQAGCRSWRYGRCCISDGAYLAGWPSTSERKMRSSGCVFTSAAPCFSHWRNSTCSSWCAPACLHRRGRVAHQCIVIMTAG